MLFQYSNDNTCRFRSFGKGLYYLDVSNPEIIPLTTESGNTDYSLLSNVNENMDEFTCEDIEGADRARDLEHILGWPSYKQLINALSKNMIINCLALSDDVIRAHEIYGKATAIMKGKMARKNTNNIEFKQHIPIKE